MGLGLGMDFFAGLSEGKPEIPAFVPVDVQAEQKKAIAGNAAVLPELERQAGNINNFNQDQLLGQFRKAIPGFDDMMRKGNSLIQDELSGVIPQDVQDMIQRSDAGKALAGGYGGSGMGRNLTARDLGLTSLQMTDKGLDSASRWIQMGRQFLTPGLADVTAMFVSPQMQTAVAVGDRDAKFQRDYVSNMNDWQHSIGYLWGQDMRNTGETIKSIAVAYAGGGMGGGGSSPDNNSSKSGSQMPTYGAGGMAY